MPISVFATVTPKPEHVDHARSAIRAILAPTRAESGCLTFDLHDSADGRSLHLYEVWVDQAAFDAHHEQAYTRVIYRQYEDWLAAPVDVIFTQPVA